MNEQTEIDLVRLKRFTEAMTHGSYEGEKNNKQLALLGDAVIDLAVCEYILENSPALAVGAITEQRAAVVNSTFLAQRARALGLPDHLLLAEQLKGEEQTEHILAESLEALTGALFVECGYERAKKFTVDHIIPDTIAMETWNPKGKLQEVIQNAGLGTPKYITRENETRGKQNFEATVYLGGKVFGEGIGASKREAEEQAAKNALLTWKQ